MARTTTKRLGGLMKELSEACGGKAIAVERLAKLRWQVSAGVTVSPYKDGCWSASWFSGSNGTCAWHELELSASEIADGSALARINERMAS